MTFNAFTLQLTQYIKENHPDRIEDKEFIDQRGEKALAVFVECSRQGRSVEESVREANEILYQGLHFSPFRMIADMVETHCSHLPLSEEGRHVLAMAILHKSKYVLAGAYTPATADVFAGSYKYHRTRTQIKRIMNKYLYDNGLQ